MGILVRYIGPDGDVTPPGEQDPRPIANGEIVEVDAARARPVLRDPQQPWMRVENTDPEYVPAADR